MTDTYTIRSNDAGCSDDREQLLREVMSSWPWPYPHSGVLSPYKRSIDESLIWNAFAGNALVGFSSCTPAGETDGMRSVSATYPLCADEHPDAGDTLLDCIEDCARSQGAERIDVAAQILSDREARILKARGYTDSPRFTIGTKMYYEYDLRRGPIPEARVAAHGIQISGVEIPRDLDMLVPAAKHWFISWESDRVRSYLEEDPKRFRVLGHFAIWEEHEIVAACYLKPNFLRSTSLAAAYYIYARSALHLRALISCAVNACIDHGFETLLVDLVNEHRQFEHDYEALGFRKVADYRVLEKSF